MLLYTWEVEVEGEEEEEATTLVELALKRLVLLHAKREVGVGVEECLT